MKAPVPRPTLRLVDKVSRSCGYTPGKVTGQRVTVKAEMNGFTPGLDRRPPPFRGWQYESAFAPCRGLNKPLITTSHPQLIHYFFAIAFTSNIIGRRSSSSIPGISIISLGGSASSTTLSSNPLFSNPIIICVSV